MDVKEIQKRVELFTKEKDLNTTLDVRVMDLVSEVGELAKEVLKGTDYGKKSFTQSENWCSELGDVLFSLICLANTTETNLEESINKVFDKYEKRFAASGTIGSE